MTKKKTFTRSRNNRMIAGVMGGVADYFGWNATWLRIIFVLISFFSVAFPGILVYILAWIIIPDAPKKQITIQQIRVKMSHQTMTTDLNNS
jgi:phage shock protein C